MRRTLQHITWVCLLTGTTSCGVSRYLPPGEKLYGGASIEIQKGAGSQNRIESFGKTAGFTGKAQA
jgi:hypothetical protein